MQVLERVRTLVETRDLRQADAILETLINGGLMSDELAEAWLYRARVRLLQSRPHDALRALDHSQHYVPTRRPDIIALRGDAYLLRYETSAIGFRQRADLAQAQHQYTHLLATYRGYANIAWVHYQQGRVALMQDDAPRATVLFCQALERPSVYPFLHAYCYERLAYIAYYDQHDAENADQHLQQAIATAPTQIERRWLIGVYLLQSRVLRARDVDRALASARTARELAEALNDQRVLADVHFTTAEIARAVSTQAELVINHLNAFIALTSPVQGIAVQQARAYEMIGDVHFEHAEYEEAQHAYTQALAINPYHPFAEALIYRSAWGDYQQRRYQRVIHRLSDYLQTTDTPSDYRLDMILAHSLFAVQAYEQADSVYRYALTKAPRGRDADVLRQYQQIAQYLKKPL